jgi:hypothetical protein
MTKNQSSLAHVVSITKSQPSLVSLAKNQLSLRFTLYWCQYIISDDTSSAINNLTT